MSTQSPKLKEFLKEIDKLSKRYQYRLFAKLEFTQTGIVPRLGVQETLPPKKGKKNGK